MLKRNSYKKSLIVVTSFVVILIGILFISPSKVEAKTVNVISKEISEGVVFKYSYNKNGTLKCITRYTNGKKEHMTKYKYYKNGKLKEYYGIPIINGHSKAYCFKYNKKGQVKELISVATSTFKVKKRKNGKATKIEEYNLGSGEKESIHTITYNKKGKITKTVYISSDYKRTEKVKYDKKNNIVKVGDSKFKNSYKKGLLVKRNVNDFGYKYTEKYKYKKIKLSGKNAKRAKKQQWALLNGVSWVPGLTLAQI